MLALRDRGRARHVPSRRAASTCASAGGRWRIASVRGGRGRPPWEVGPLRRAPHAALRRARAAGRARSTTCWPSLESGYEAIRGVLARGRLRRRYLVVVAAATPRRRARSRPRSAASRRSPRSPTPRSTRAGPRAQTVGVRLAAAARRLPAFAGARPGRAAARDHARAHARGARGRDLGPHARLAGRGRRDLRVGRPARRAAGRRPRRRCRRPAAIARASGDAQAAAYAASSAAAFAIADRFGARRLLELYDAFNDPELAGRRGRGSSAAPCGASSACRWRRSQCGGT